MLGHSHATSGALIWAGAVPLVAPAISVGLAPADVVVGTLVCAGAALLPDLDHHDGTIANFFGRPSEALCRFVNWASGGHRHATHSLLFVLFSALLTWAGALALGQPFVLGVVFVMLALAFRALGLAPNGKSDVVGVWIAVEAAVGTYLVSQFLPTSTAQWLPFAVGLGSLAHLLGDCLTVRGCPLFWPWRVRLGLPLIGRTGNRVERWLLTPAMGLGTLVILWFGVLQGGRTPVG